MALTIKIIIGIAVFWGLSKYVIDPLFKDISESDWQWDEEGK